MELSSLSKERGQAEWHLTNYKGGIYVDQKMMGYLLHHDTLGYPFGKKQISHIKKSSVKNSSDKI